MFCFGLFLMVIIQHLASSHAKQMHLVVTQNWCIVMIIMLSHVCKKWMYVILHTCMSVDVRTVCVYTHAILCVCRTGNGLGAATSREGDWRRGIQCDIHCDSTGFILWVCSQEQDLPVQVIELVSGIISEWDAPQYHCNRWNKLPVYFRKYCRKYTIWWSVTVKYVENVTVSH